MIGKHASESLAHLDRINQFFALHNARSVEGLLKAIKLIIDDPDGNIPDIGDPDRSDLVLMIQVVRVEQFETRSYEIVARVAEQLGFAEDTEMLLEFFCRTGCVRCNLRTLFKAI